MAYKIEGWICTDPDRGQYGRKITDNTFEFRESNVIECINISEYTLEEIDNHIDPYYDSVEYIRALYGDDTNWIIAECIFEQESGLY